MTHKFLFLDTETTGNEVEKDRLAQVSFELDDIMHSGMFKPPLPISVKSMSITHITNKMVENEELFQGSKMYTQLETLLKDHIFVAHNALFDKAIVEAEGLIVPQFICTLRVARYLDEEAVIPEYNLQFLRYYLDLDVHDAPAHDATGDVKVLRALFDRLLAKMKEKIEDDDKAVEEMIRVSMEPSILKKFTFGKYKGQNIEDVVKTDKGYLEWLWKQKVADNTDPNVDDMMFTIKKYLGK